MLDHGVENDATVKPGPELCNVFVVEASTPSRGFERRRRQRREEESASAQRGLHAVDQEHTAAATTTACADCAGIHLGRD